MKAILVPVEMHDRLRSVLETALLLARRFGSLLEGFALRPIMTEFVPVDMVGGLTWTQDDLVDPEEARRAREAFEAFMREREVPLFAEGHEGPVHRWFDADSPGDAAVGSVAASSTSRSSGGRSRARSRRACPRSRRRCSRAAARS